MNTYKGIYYIVGTEDQPASVSILKDKLVVEIKDEYGNPRKIFWLYENIIQENFWKTGKAVVRTKHYPPQVLEIGSKEFVDELDARFRNQKTFGGRARNFKLAALLKVLIVFLALLLAGYFWFVPWIAERLAKKVPVSYEESIGNGMFNSLKNGFVVDNKKTLYINDFFRELKVHTDYNIKITVVKDTIVNAFAIPGGNIVVYDKLIDEMGSYEELAALLSHEFTHVNNKHSTRSLFRKLGSVIFFSVIVGDLGSIAGTLIGQADNLKGLTYSRKLEKEADINGLLLLSERKIDCNGFVRLFEVLKKEMTKLGEDPAEWISSHPDLDKRIKYVKEHKLFNINGIEKNETLDSLFKQLQASY